MVKVLFLISFIFSFGVFGQNLNGIINSYYQVTSINANLSTVTVSNPSGISPNDSMLIMQMQGASIDNTSDVSSNGEVTDYNGTGHYELVEVCSVSGNTVVFKKMLENTYSTAGVIQLISFNTTQNAVITGTVSCDPWNGSTGGVVVIYDLGALVFNSDIDASGMGFRGGQHDESLFSCSFLGSNSDFSYDISTGRGAWKGEGIAPYGTNEAGRGPLGNGGGGGNDHNAGGGGGSNISAGGDGGENDDPGTFNCKGYFPGLGGRALATNNERIFMGGGGGAGHSNSNFPSGGANGGGIVIVIAQSIDGNGNAILASGHDAIDSHGDGAGGGGAGGSVFISSNSVNAGLTIDVHGGDGGNMDASAAANTNRCFGPGGGGSGGLVRVGPTSLAGLTTVLNGGQAGIVLNSTAGCNGTTVNALNGSNGVEEQNGLIIESNKCNNSCPLVTNVDLGPDTNLCGGDIIVLEGNNPGLPHLWSNNETTEFINVTTGGLYKVEITGPYCIACDSVIITESPGLVAPNNTSFNQCDDPSISLDAGNSGSTYAWSTGETDQMIVVSQSGTYSVTVTNVNCILDIDFEVIPCLYIPNTITPNNDGSNDFWEIDGLQDYPNHEVFVFNRRNQEIYRSINYNNDFTADGFPSGVYYYRIDLGNGFDPVLGTLTVVR